MKKSKPHRSNAWRVLSRLGICECYSFVVEKIDVKKLMSVSDKELLSTRSCGPVTLDAIHKIQGLLIIATDL